MAILSPITAIRSRMMSRRIWVDTLRELNVGGVPREVVLKDMRDAILAAMPSYLNRDIPYECYENIYGWNFRALPVNHHDLNTVGIVIGKLPAWSSSAMSLDGQCGDISTDLLATLGLMRMIPAPITTASRWKKQCVSVNHQPADQYNPERHTETQTGDEWFRNDGNEYRCLNVSAYADVSWSYVYTGSGTPVWSRSYSLSSEMVTLEMGPEVRVGGTLYMVYIGGTEALGEFTDCNGAVSDKVSLGRWTAGNTVTFGSLTLPPIPECPGPVPELYYNDWTDPMWQPPSGATYLCMTPTGDYYVGSPGSYSVSTSASYDYRLVLDCDFE